MTDKNTVGKDKIIVAIKNTIGEEAFADGIFLEDKLCLVSEVRMITRVCNYCSVEITGSRENVYALLALHDYGHEKDEKEMFINMQLDRDDDDDEEGGIPL
jgi:hypothetical protein